MGVWTGTVPTILAGDIPTGDDWKTILDIETALSSSLTTYTPSWITSGVAPALGNGTLLGRYTEVGGFHWVQVMLTMGTTTTYGTGFFAFTLPGSGANLASTDAVGSARLFDTSASAHYGATSVSPTGVNYVKMLFGSSGEVTGASPFTFATGDVVALSLLFQG